ncbi:MAG: beta-ketoacyl-ACP synthase III [Alphaproteobacteria bacterium]|nr:beta-ketoacyl-ACP synthase III [Alphaproteobacteria bacterium]
MIQINSVASYLPQEVVTNDDLSKTLDTSHEWIYTRTGIASRHVAADDEFTSDLAFKAAESALKKANLDPKDLDAIIVTTITSDRRFPSVACKIQGELGASKAFAFDISAACAGFIYGLAVADSMMKSMNLKNVLLIGSETLTKFVDWTDRSTCVLFGDGAGAFVLQNSDDNSRGIIATKLYSNGEEEKYNYLLAHSSLQKVDKTYVTMAGRSVFKYAIEYMSMSMTEILKENNMTIDDIDWIVPHQANKRILESMCKMKDFPIEKVIITTETHANTSSASIPLALDDAMTKGIIKKGDTLLFTALGAGITWGSAIIKL